MQIKNKMIFITILIITFISGCLTFKGATVNKDFDDGVALFNKGDCENAKVKFENAVQKDPDLWEGYLYIANCALNKADLKESLNSAKKAVSHTKNKKTWIGFQHFILQVVMLHLKKKITKMPFSFLASVLPLRWKTALVTSGWVSLYWKEEKMET